MPKLPDMEKHRGFPSRLPSSDYQFTIRRPNKSGAVPIKARERYADRRNADRLADEGFMEALWKHFGDQPFERGNLDAGRLSWVFGREVLPHGDNFDASDYEAMLIINVPKAMASFPEAFEDDE
jgi:hypothetical protein